jgi:hypothetical protein
MAVAVFGSPPLLVFFWVWRFKIVIEGDTLTYRSLLQSRSIRKAEIRSSKTSVGEYTGWDRLSKPFLCLELTSYDWGDDWPIRINLAVFRSEDVRLLLDFVGKKGEPLPRIF